MGSSSSTSNENLIPDLAVAIPSRTNGGLSRRQDDHLSSATRRDVARRRAVHVCRRRLHLQRDHRSEGAVPASYVCASGVRHGARSLHGGGAPQETVGANTWPVVLQRRGRADCAEALARTRQDMLTDPRLQSGRHGTAKFVRWDRGNEIVLAPNPNYFGGAPQLKEVDVVTVPDANTMLTMVRAHELDVAELSTPSQVSTLQGVEGIRV